MIKLWLIVIFVLINQHAAMASSFITPKGEVALLNDLRFLSSDLTKGRLTGSLGSAVARNYIIEQLQHIDIKPLEHVYQVPFQFSYKNELVQGSNIIGYLPALTTSERYIIISAHYDHIGFSTRGIYNGADDNASGVAVVLSLARTLKKLSRKHHIVLLFTDGEEQKLQGAKAFVKQFPNIIKNTVLNINIDMVATSRKTNRLYMLSKNTNKTLPSHYITQFKALADDNITLINGFNRSRTLADKKVQWLKASDHYVFYRHKIPVIYYGTGMHQNYHTTSDTFENVNLPMFLRVANTINEHVSYIDRIAFCC